jgi:hypothetical protein
LAYRNACAIEPEEFIAETPTTSPLALIALTVVQVPPSVPRAVVVPLL